MASFTCGRCGENIDVTAGVSKEKVGRELIAHRQTCRAPREMLRSDGLRGATRRIVHNGHGDDRRHL